MSAHNTVLLCFYVFFLHIYSGVSFCKYSPIIKKWEHFRPVNLLFQMDPDFVIWFICNGRLSLSRLEMKDGINIEFE